MAFAFDTFVDDVRRAAKTEDANAAIRALLQQAVADPQAILDSQSEGDDGEVSLYEDDALSIWQCKFEPHLVLPPHEHLVDTHIAVYSGAEKNILFRVADGALKHDGTTIVGPGEVMSMTPDCIHAVTAEGDVPSFALHVYLGPLMQLERSLFDWDTGQRIELTLAKFESLKRPSSTLPQSLLR